MTTTGTQPTGGITITAKASRILAESKEVREEARAFLKEGREVIWVQLVLLTANTIGIMVNLYMWLR